MSGVGRGRGYSGRHHQARPGMEDDALRTLQELSPRATDSREREKRDMDTEKRDEEKRRETEKRQEEDDETGMIVKLECISAEDDAALKDLLHVDEQFQPLLLLLEQFSPSEDGIQFNRKLRQFETTITNMCPDENRLQQAFATFRAAALLSPVTARKLAGVGASFTRQQRQQVLRSALLNVIMQGTYSKLDILERANPLFLINAANLMGDYFAEARLCNGNKVHILAAPLLHYMKALLASDDIRAHRSLATQLMQNGRELQSVLSTELEEVSIGIRLRILSPPPCGIIWLLLSADMCLNKFLPLPNSLQQFYAAHLNLTADDSYSEVSRIRLRILSPPPCGIIWLLLSADMCLNKFLPLPNSLQQFYATHLNLTAHDSYSEVSYGSWKKSPEKEEKTDSTEKVSHNLSNVSLNHDDETKPKLRPILGAGAGLLRQEHPSVSQDSFDTWSSQSKTNLTKRYDLNSWRQEEEKKEEPVYDPTVLPPTTNLPPSFDYPPPRFNQNFQENFNNYLQQGDGTYIQNQYSYQEYFPERSERSVSESERSVQEQNQTLVPERADKIERVNNEIQKTSSHGRKPIENWRKEKSDLKEDSNKKNWTRQHSRDNLSSEEDKDVRSLSKSSRDSRPVTRTNRRNSGDVSDSGISGKTPPRRHVSDVPRNHKYWDHDDRCDKDYNS